MKLHFFSPAHISHRSHQESHHDLFYATMFVIGAPATVIGSMYLVDIVFNLVWR